MALKNATPLILPITGKLSLKLCQKPENRYMYIPYKSTHPRNTIKNYVTGELKRYMRMKFNTKELNFLKKKVVLSLECVTMGSQKISCHISFLRLNILIMPNSLQKTHVKHVIFREHDKQRQIVC